jgi:hypothetical protein
MKVHALGRLRQEGSSINASLGYMVRPYLKKKNEKSIAKKLGGIIWPLNSTFKYKMKKIKNKL